MRQEKLDKLCRGYKVLRPRLTKYWRGRVPGVPGGVDAYVGDCLSPNHLAVDENAIDCGYLIRLFCSENLNHFANIFLAFQHKAMYAL